MSGAFVAAMGLAIDETTGMYARQADGGLFDCTTLTGAGSDDQVFFSLIVVFLPSMLLRLVRLARPVPLWEAIVHGVALLIYIQIIMNLRSCGEIVATQAVRDDWLLPGVAAGLLVASVAIIPTRGAVRV
jgi:hypothetical protein